MKHGSLFSGIGGFDLAAEWMGWENVFHCEWDTFGQKILKHYWPEAKSYHDITKTDFTQHRGSVDIITGGFPCQPFSLAGKQQGTSDARYLWPEMLRVIREVRPRWVVAENVYGLVNWSDGMVFDTVCADLENEGFQVWPFVLPAAVVNAPHRRDRVWFIAYCNAEQRKREESGFQPIFTNGSTEVITYSEGKQGQRTGFEQQEAGGEEQRESGRRNSEMGNRNVADADVNFRSERWLHETRSEEAERHFSSFDTWEIRDTWENFPTQSPICSGDDGLPDKLDGITFSKWRNESIKAYGNAIVPQVALQIFKTICEFETSI